MESKDLVRLARPAEDGSRSNVIIDTRAVCENLDLLVCFLCAFDRVVGVFVDCYAGEGFPFGGVAQRFDFFDLFWPDRAEGSR